MKKITRYFDPNIEASNGNEKTDTDQMTEVLMYFGNGVYVPKVEVEELDKVVHSMLPAIDTEMLFTLRMLYEPSVWEAKTTNLRQQLGKLFVLLYVYRKQLFESEPVCRFPKRYRLRFSNYS